MLIRCSHVSKSFGSHRVLDDFSCEIPAASSYALVGPSGSGKSTLLNMFAGLDVPDCLSDRKDTDEGTGGRMTCGDVCISDLPHRSRERWRLAHVGMLRQDLLLDPTLTAYENVYMPAIFRHIPHAQDEALELLTALGLAHYATHLCGVLSSGQSTRVALARALMGKPDILIVDEPTGTLDPHNARALGDILHHMSRTYGCTLILATHDQQLAASCDQSFTCRSSLAPITPPITTIQST